MSKSVRIRFSPGETGWAEHIEGNKYRINNIPLADDLNIDDIVICNNNLTDFLEICGVLERRYHLKSPIQYERREQYKLIFSKAEEMGCKVEGMTAPRDGEPGICLIAHNDTDNIQKIIDECGIETPQYLEETEQQEYN
jgi:hypothetical protein